MNARVFALLAVLTLVAGYVDAVAFFGLGVFTANMTGNTVLLAGGIAGRFVPPLPGAIGMVLPGLSLAAFCAGALGVALVLRAETGRPPRRTIAVMCAVAVALAGAAALQHWGGHAMTAPAVGLLSLVMGAQSVVATRAGLAGVSTTFVTGTLVRSIVDLAGTPSPAPLVRAEGRANGAIWALYLTGAVAGAFGLRAFGADALWPAAAVVALLLAVI